MRHRMGKAWLLLVVLMLVLSACAADQGGGSASSGETSKPAEDPGAAENEPLEPVTLKIMIPGDRPKSMDAVVAEAEKRMAGTLNVKLDVQFIPWSDIDQKTKLVLSTGQEADLIFDAPWLHLNEMVEFYEPLDQLLQQYGPDVLNTRPANMWEANKISGNIVGIPLGAFQSGTPSSNHTYLVRKDIREKLGIAPIRSYEDLVKFMYAVKEKEPSIIPFSTSNSAASMSEATFRFQYDYETHLRTTHALGQSLVLHYKNNDGKVYNLFDEMDPKFWEYVTNARTLYLDKIIDPDMMATKGNHQLLKAGKQAVGSIPDFGVPTDIQAELEKNVPGAVLEAVTFYQFEPGKNISNFVQGNFICVPVASKNKERAIQFLNWAHQKENYELLAYGIQGVDWEEAGDKLYKPLGDGYRWFPYAWIWNPTHDRLNASQGEDAIKANQFIMNGDNFVADILTGFSFDSTPVANELAQYNSLEAKYYIILVNGVGDPDQVWNDFKGEAASYVKKIQQELEKQISEFLAKK